MKRDNVVLNIFLG